MDANLEHLKVMVIDDSKTIQKLLTKIVAPASNVPRSKILIMQVARDMVKFAKELK